MVLQQCLSCNTLMASSSRACVCGHVFEEESRFIGGKRFSEYRAELYSRLETRREARLKNVPSSDHPRPIKSKAASKGRFSASGHTSMRRKRKKQFSCLRSNPSSALKKAPPKRYVVPPELLGRLPGALKEINKRIIAQNVVWLALQTEKRITA